MTTQTVKVTGVKIKGESLNGSYPVVRIDEAEGKVVVAHPQHGNIKVPRANTNLPETAPVILSYDALLTEIRSRFAVLDSLMDGVVAGRTRSLIVSGAPGVGKSHGIEAKLAAGKAAGLVKKFTIVKGVVSPISLYVLMHEHRRAGEVIVLDDSDEIYYDSIGANLIKAATDSGKNRIVSYMKEVALLEANGIPKSFSFSGALICASNLDFEKEVAQRSKVGVHLGAILNRALYLSLGLNSQQALLARVEDVARTTSMLKDEGLNDLQIESLILWMKENAVSVRSLSLRTAMALAGLIMTNPTDWKKIAAVTLLKTSTR